MKIGIQVTKYHYSKQGQTRVKLWLSQDEKALYYKSLDTQRSNILAFVRGARKIKFSDIGGFVYGPYTWTFKQRKQVVIEASFGSVDYDKTINYKSEASSQDDFKLGSMHHKALNIEQNSSKTSSIDQSQIDNLSVRADIQNQTY